MSNTTHTPGPWIHSGGQIYPDATAPTIAMIPSFDKKDQEQQANARLIAAAPELLEALRGCIDELELHKKFAEQTGDTDLIYRLNAAWDAVIKAEGK